VGGSSIEANTMSKRQGRNQPDAAEWHALHPQGLPIADPATTIGGATTAFHNTTGQNTYNLAPLDKSHPESMDQLIAATAAATIRPVAAYDSGMALPAGEQFAYPLQYGEQHQGEQYYSQQQYGEDIEQSHMPSMLDPTPFAEQIRSGQGGKRSTTSRAGRKVTSCEQCLAIKYRCNGRQPCNRCKDHKKTCTYARKDTDFTIGEQEAPIPSGPATQTSGPVSQPFDRHRRPPPRRQPPPPPNTPPLWARYYICRGAEARMRRDDDPRGSESVELRADITMDASRPLPSDPYTVIGWDPDAPRFDPNGRSADLHALLRRERGVWIMGLDPAAADAMRARDEGVPLGVVGVSEGGHYQEIYLRHSAC
jgi:hypothetical protein